VSIDRRILDLIKRQDYYEALKKAIEYQKNELKCPCGSRNLLRKTTYTWSCTNCGKEIIYMGFHTTDLSVPPHTLYRLAQRGVLQILYRSGRGVRYWIPNEKDVEMLLKLVEGGRGVTPPSKPLEIPEDIFSPIEGYEDIKKILLMSLKSDKIVHILMVGPPSSAKSLILQELNRIDGSYMVLAGTSTRAGIRDVIMEYEPRLLLIDEIDKIQDPNDLSVLLTLMESQRFIVTMATKRVDMYLPCRVIAAANTTRGLPPELLSRFLVFRFRPYTQEELERVIIKVLTEREGVGKDLAEYIADRVINVLKSSDPRDAVKICRLARNKKDVDTVVKIMKKYSARYI